MKKIVTIFALLFTFALMAQQPTHVPGPQTNTPIDLTSWFDIVVFIILPLIMVFFYFQWRHQVKKEREEAKKHNNNSK